MTLRHISNVFKIKREKKKKTDAPNAEDLTIYWRKEGVRMGQVKKKGRD